MQAVQHFQYTEPGKVPDALAGLSQPVLLRGFINHWPAVQKARQSDKALIQYLCDYSANLLVTFYQIKKGVEGGRVGYLEDFSGFTFDRAAGPLNTVLNSLSEAASSRYIGSTRVDKWLPEFRQKNDIEFNGKKPLANFWIGNPTDISAHFDSPLNIACCVSGVREFTLFPPDQIANLYIGPPDRTPSGRAISMVNFERPDLTRFPRLHLALEQALVAELTPGDALFIPPLWWHRVKSERKINMLVNYWWKETPDHMGIPDLALEHAILTIRGMNKRDKKAWKALFDHYVFADTEVATEKIPEHLKGMLDPDNEQAARLAWLNLSKKFNA